MELAARWGRAHNTLSSWRTRPHPELMPLTWEIIDGCIYYSVTWLLRYEHGKETDGIRPAKLRGTPFPPPPFWPPSLIEFHGQTVESALAQLKARKAGAAVQPELPLQPTSTTGTTVDARMELEITAALDAVDAVRGIGAHVARGFKSITIAAGYALAIATDDTAYFASVLGGLEFITWKPVAALPQGDPVVALFARRAA